MELALAWSYAFMYVCMYVCVCINKDMVTKLREMPGPASDRTMAMRLPLSKDNFATIIGVYAPTMTNPDKNKEPFYNQLENVLSDIPRTDNLLLIGDFNARIGRDNDKWPLVMGKHGIGKCHSSFYWLRARVRTDSDEHHVPDSGI